MRFRSGHYLKEEAKIVQAYADDVLLFAKGREGLDKVLTSVVEFLEFTKIELNPVKCTALKYTGESERYVEPVRLHNLKDNKWVSLP
jgi:hypothetical protein